jgi:hypothetical protein
MAAEMPDIHVDHIATPTRTTTLGARGVGEAGAVGAAAAIWTAVNDALVPLGATVTSQPLTPEHVLARIAHAREAEARAAGRAEWVATSSERRSDLWVLLQSRSQHRRNTK